MKIYFSSNQFSELQSFDFKQRQTIIEMAKNKLTAPAKLLLNILKLLILIPPFILLARIDSWLFFIPIALLLVGYFIILRPISLMFIKKHLSSAVVQFNKNNT